MYSISIKPEMKRGIQGTQNWRKENLYLSCISAKQLVEYLDCQREGIQKYSNTFSHFLHTMQHKINISGHPFFLNRQLWKNDARVRERFSKLNHRYLPLNDSSQSFELPTS